MLKYTVEMVCGSKVHNYEGKNGTYEVIFPIGGDSVFSLAFFPYGNKSAPIAVCYSWDFVPTGENRFYYSGERLADIERKIVEFENRLTK